ncbi:hypothetical protein PC128_g24079, partial [Phytophthora cactorum]
TPHIVFIPVIGDLDEEDNAVTKLPVDVERFIREAPGVQIPPHIVKPIKIEDFKKVSETLRGEQEQLLNDKMLLERRLAELMENSYSFWDIFGKLRACLVSAADCLTPSMILNIGQHAAGNTIMGTNPQMNDQLKAEDYQTNVGVLGTATGTEAQLQNQQNEGGLLKATRMIPFNQQSEAPQQQLQCQKEHEKEGIPLLTENE